MNPIFLIAAELPAILAIGASRQPIEIAASGASVTLFNRQEIEALGMPSATDLLRLTPGVSVAVSGPRGSQTQLRIRGNEANHSLLFIDGIEANDPATGNEARFETLLSDGLERLEIIRGAQSALWGAEAIGGVISAETAIPERGSEARLLAEGGSLGTARASASLGTGSATSGLAATASWIDSKGIDTLGLGGDRDGFSSFSGTVKGEVRPNELGALGLTARYSRSRSEFDGTDPLTYLRADTLDNSVAESLALRGYARLGDNAVPWSAELSGTWLDSSNRNFSGDVPLNRSDATRLKIEGQLSHRFALGGLDQRMTLAIARKDEVFRARDTQYFGATNQRRSRANTAFVGEWRARIDNSAAFGISLRHDVFNRFADATTLRADGNVALGLGLSVHASYGEGIAQPTFYDLYGYFPGSFAGNPALKPERSQGYEAGLGWSRDGMALKATWFQSRLTDEIVDVWDPETYLSSTANATGKSKRRGVELSGETRLGDAITVDASYTWLKASEQRVAGSALAKERRRPRHSAALRVTGQWDRLTLGASAAWIGKRRDMDFDSYQMVTLDDYLLATVQIGWKLTERIEAYGRVENALDADYQDVVGYRTPGRTGYAGLRLRLGD